MGAGSWLLEARTGESGDAPCEPRRSGLPRAGTVGESTRVTAAVACSVQCVNELKSVSSTGFLKPQNWLNSRRVLKRQMKAITIYGPYPDPDSSKLVK